MKSVLSFVALTLLAGVSGCAPEGEYFVGGLACGKAATGTGMSTDYPSSSVKPFANLTPSTTLAARVVHLKLSREGTLPSGATLTLVVIEDNAGVPSGATKGSTTISLDARPLTTTATYQPFAFSDLTLNAGTKYWLGLSSNQAFSAANRVVWTDRAFQVDTCAH